MGTIMRKDSIARQSPDVVARPLAEGEGGVLLHLDSGAYFSVNPVGLVIWELIDGHRTIADLVEALGERIEGVPPTLEADVVAFVDRAADRKLIVVDG